MKPRHGGAKWNRRSQGAAARPRGRGGGGALPDGTPVIVSGDDDRTMRVWRLADGTPVVPPLDLPESVQAVTIHGIVIVTAAGADIAVHQPALARPMR